MLHKLRVIHLFEADLNLLTGIWSRRLDWNGEQHNAFNPEQWGNKTGARSSDVAMLKRLSYEYSALTRTDLGTFDNDAMACYDRIIVDLATLRNRQLGLPKEAALLRAHCLRQHQYSVKTLLGVSSQSYSHSADTPQHGTGQGSRGAPMDWKGQSTVLLDAAEGIPMHMVNPTQQLWVTRKFDGYVDDVTGWTNCARQLREDTHGQTEVSPIQSQLQQLAQDWEHLITCSGGRLELSKCFYYLLQWTFQEHGRPRLRNLPPSTISIKDTTDGRPYQIHHKPVDVPHRTLGAYISPNSNESQAIEAISTKARWFAQHTRITKLSAADIQMVCRIKYLPAMLYILITSAIPEAQLQKAQRPATMQFATALGYNRNFPLALLHSPPRLGGTPIPDLYIEQGTQHILFLLRHLRTPSMLQRTVQVVLDWYQLVSGLGQSVWTDVHTPVELYTQADWLNNTRIFLRSSDLTLTVNTFRTTPHRSADRFLMDDATAWYTNAAIYLEDINNCRLYLQVTTLSEIATADGREIQPAIFHSASNPQPKSLSTSTHLWPRQACPSVQAWNKWNKFISTYTWNGSMLRNPLGPWYTVQQDRRWPWMYDTHRNLIWQPDITNGAPSRVYQADHHRRYWTIDLGKPHTANISTSEIIPASVPIDSMPQYPDRFIPVRHQGTHDPKRTIEARDWTHPFRHFKTLDMHRLQTALDKGEPLIGVSDGGKETTEGTFGWVLAAGDKIVAEGYGAAWGCPMQSHRAEGFGNIGILLYLFTTMAMSDTAPHNPVQLLCDNKALLLNKRQHAHRQYDTPDRDVLSTIDLLCQEMAFRISHGHVPGHQDTRGKRGKNLTLAEQYNIRADALAHRANANPQLMAEAITAQPFPATIPYLGQDNIIFTSCETTVLRESLAEKDYVEYLREIKGWSDTTINAIDWYSRYTALEALPANTHRTITKLTHGWLATNNRQHTMDNRHNAACPLCGLTETNTHLLRCHGQTQWKQRTLRECKELLRKHNTAADLQQSILYCMECWLTDSPVEAQHGDYHKGIGDAEFSWQLVFTGHVPIRWVHLQASSQGRQYWPDKGGNTWSRHLCKYLMSATSHAWTKRNQMQHDPAGINNESRHHHTMYLKITALCQERHRLLVRDQDYFEFDSKEFCENKGARRLQKWYETASKFFQESLTRAQTQAKYNLQDIRKFFQRRKTTGHK